jgi:hypothetical protein
MTVGTSENSASSMDSPKAMEDVIPIRNRGIVANKDLFNMECLL